MKCALLFLTVTVLVTGGTANVSLEAKHLRAFTDDLIHYVNDESGAQWKAGPSRRFQRVEEVESLLGVRFEAPTLRNARRMTISHQVNVDILPESFDPREQWPNCTSIGEIRDQSSCGSCWPLSTVFKVSLLCTSPNISYNLPKDEKVIMYELMKNGPVEDFPNYSEGIYHHVAGDYLGVHAVRLMGWSAENGTPYWLLSNSWNDEWGEK
ncbi:hypothetical protein P879_07810 [Paragonimus westermani]|uniref:Peptidase C1A papain C-terminal domain-containing protein n=1 Tax=Paragonimus westermani TaxID=34504 RepID=A0A8T0DCV0_9TREM|nr:hypothetical protein P879_07810 [Paragonimus westermani]